LEPVLLNVQKPARYIGGEIGSVVKAKDGVDVRFAFCFPDTYDVGMSHLGMKILYSLINSREHFWCERVFMPYPDMDKAMRGQGIPLYALESLQPIDDFDFIGFTLQYELTYTNILAMLSMAGVNLLSAERTGALGSVPIIIAGGPCACNPEPLADFIDLFVIGEGEEVTLELLDLYAGMKAEGASKADFLIEAGKIGGVYVPALYDVAYNSDGTIQSISPDKPVTKRIVSDLNGVFYPETFVLPFCEIVHDRAVEEVLRGCIRGCRFCQAGFIYRPYREKSEGVVLQQSRSLCDSTGYDEMSLVSLSTGDHSRIEDMLKSLSDYTDKAGVGLSLPSLRIDKFSDEMVKRIQAVRKSGLTFAPEAGTQRLRDVINKNITEEDILQGCRTAFAGGYTAVKLYFMLGLPTETLEDIEGIKLLTDKIVTLFSDMARGKKCKPLSISISLSTFIPKPFTPFEFEPQPDKAEIERRQKYLLSIVKDKRVRVSWSDYDTTLVEAVLARADRRVGRAVLRAFELGCRLDGWGEYFKPELWYQAFADCGIDPAFYVNRQREYTEIMPWNHLNMLVSRAYLINENKRAHEGQTTPNCREGCSGCGVNLSECDYIREGSSVSQAEIQPKNTEPLPDYPPLYEPEPKRIRFIFCKTGRAKYISHLDLQRVFLRAVARAKLPLWETEGFHRHVYLTFALPLSLGQESLCEILEAKLIQQMPLNELTKRLNAVLPKELMIRGCEFPQEKTANIVKAEYEIRGAFTAGEVAAFLAQNSIVVQKTTKHKGTQDLDIKPFIEVKSVADGRMRLVLPAGGALTVNPSLVITALFETAGRAGEQARIMRTAVVFSKK
jgi:radical SAM family uncharacterized protein/radical SAM-linked protein